MAMIAPLRPSETTFTVRGTIRGDGYDGPAERSVERVYTRDEIEDDGLAGLVATLLDHEGAAFIDAPIMLADSVLVVTRRSGGSWRERAFDLLGLPSVSDYVAPDYPEFDPEG